MAPHEVFGKVTGRLERGILGGTGCVAVGEGRTGRVLLAEPWGRASPCNPPQPGPRFSQGFLLLLGVNCIYCRCGEGGELLRLGASACKGFASRWGPAACHECHQHGTLCVAAGTPRPVQPLPHPGGPASPWEQDTSVPVTSHLGWHICAWCRRLGFLRLFSFLRVRPSDPGASASFLLIQLRGGCCNTSLCKDERRPRLWFLLFTSCGSSAMRDGG